MKKIKFSKIIVTAVIILNTLFTMAVIYLYLKTSGEPETLIGAWFSFTTVELFSLAGIEKRKVDKIE